MFVLLYATNIYFCKEIKNDIDQKMMNSMKTPQEIAEMISKRFYPLPDADLDSLASIIESSKAAKRKESEGLGGRMQRMIDTVSKMDMSAHPQVTELIEWRKAYDES